MLNILNFLVDVNFTDQNGQRPEFQLEIPVKFKTPNVLSIIPSNVIFGPKTDQRIYFKTKFEKIYNDGFGKISDLENG